MTIDGNNISEKIPKGNPVDMREPNFLLIDVIAEYKIRG